MTARTIVLVILIIFAVLSLILGIVLAVVGHWALIFIALFFLLLLWLLWVVWNVLLSFLCDVKLIRNKLYDESNDALNVFIKSKEKLEKSRSDYVDTQLEYLQELLDAEVITVEEYKQRKRELIEEN